MRNVENRLMRLEELLLRAEEPRHEVPPHLLGNGEYPH
jgi:hypothetical protein